jgi:hypothetical protein
MNDEHVFDLQCLKSSEIAYVVVVFKMQSMKTVSYRIYSRSCCQPFVDRIFHVAYWSRPSQLFMLVALSGDTVPVVQDQLDRLIRQ